MTGEPIVQVDKLVKKYGDIVAVDQVSFNVEAGEIFGFLGPNGAGKTTTINVLCTLIKPTSGTAYLNGFDVAKHPNQVRQSIGLVFQDPSLDERLTAMENLQFHAMIYNVPRAVRQRRFEEVLCMVELYDRRNDVVKTFSGGMRRRLEIARGLLHHPKVLFLDEPTIGLDPQTRAHIWQYILTLRERENLTIFLTTHYMDEAAVADRIAIIDHGKIVALDTPDRLKAQVGGDVVSLRTIDDGRAAAEIRQRYGFDVRVNGNGQGLSFEVPNGEEFIPRLITDLRAITINSISLRRPTLDDVFLKLTGRQIRDAEAGEREVVRAMMRGRHGRGPHG